MLCQEWTGGSSSLYFIYKLGLILQLSLSAVLRVIGVDGDGKRLWQAPWSTLGHAVACVHFGRIINVKPWSCPSSWAFPSSCELGSVLKGRGYFWVRRPLHIRTQNSRGTWLKYLVLLYLAKDVDVCASLSSVWRSSFQDFEKSFADENDINLIPRDKLLPSLGTWHLALSAFVV